MSKSSHYNPVDIYGIVLDIPSNVISNLYNDSILLVRGIHMDIKLKLVQGLVTENDLMEDRM